ncbi:hypothetical protein MAR_016755 [Mya arenaria]|uniref:Uncharacterized protein n=1 Tax=Mya arenaria TaxID=6604 RepID=A0ABY7ECW8_MYAAR|nr:hypothetical protein MAR_016755 [Mya arenaria]
MAVFRCFTRWRARPASLWGRAWRAGFSPSSTSSLGSCSWPSSSPRT